MEQKQNPLTVFAQEAPGVSAAFNNLVEALRATNGLDEKTKHLLYIGIKAAMGDNTAVYYHVPMAKSLGATRAEVKDALLITVTVCGIQAIANCLPAAMEIYDR
ncbi:MAG TPA: carboxymuconolactone decarboxylase family protein [Chitinophagaceae bacterium]|nr:carboxymuconolactone decarboxylase family protein [Chitinophagaceae bacterium]